MEGTREKVEKLEAAIKHLNQVIKHLGYNSGEIKSQIHSTISRHLEALRNREVWLLSQVDLVVSAKEDVLHQQQVRLNKTLGVLQSSLNMPEEELEARLADALAKLDLCDLKPEETPYITFRADHSSLRECILNYGRVDATGLPLQSAFVAHGHPSTSLPRHFEEYEDDEHHVFYKTVEEVNRVRTASSNISVNIPKLSTRPEDWLRHPSTTTTSTTSAPRFSFPVLSPKTSDWLRCSDAVAKVAPAQPSIPVSGDASIQNWLSQIKQFPDLEEEEFEIIDRDAAAASSQKSGSTLSAFPVLEASLDSNPFQSRMPYPSPVEAWLKNSTKSASKQCFDKETMDLFKHIPKENEKWLLKTLAKETDSCSTCCCNTSPMEIENLGSSTCASQAIASRFLRDFPLDQRRWLSSYTQKTKPACPADVCKANETCASFSDCVCQPNCGSVFASFDHSPKKWLKSESSARVTSLPQIEGFGRYLRSVEGEKEMWLKDGGTSMSDNYTQDYSPMFQCISANIDDWLKDKQPGRNKNSPSITALNFDFKHGKDDRNMWLKVSECQSDASSSAAVTCKVWDTIMDHVGQMSASDWLIKTSTPSNETEKSDDTKDKGDEKDEYTNKWLWMSTTPTERVAQVVPDIGDWLYQKTV